MHEAFIGYTWPEYHWCCKGCCYIIIKLIKTLGMTKLDLLIFSTAGWGETVGGREERGLSAIPHLSFRLFSCKLVSYCQVLVVVYYITRLVCSRGCHFVSDSAILSLGKLNSKYAVEKKMLSE